MSVSRKTAAPKLRVVEGGRSTKRDADVRWDKIRSARERITDGYYDRLDVRERVLTAVLDEIDEP